jgi:hypothetical protein
VLVDVRNVYESRVGYFSVPGIETIRPPLRQFSDFPRHRPICALCRWRALRACGGVTRGLGRCEHIGNQADVCRLGNWPQAITPQE